MKRFETLWKEEKKLFLFAVEQIQGVGTAHLGQLFLAPEIEGFEERHTHTDSGGGANQTFFHRVVKFAVGFEDGIVAQDEVTAGFETGGFSLIAGDDHLVNAFGADEDLEQITGEVVSVRDAHGGQSLFGKSGPDGVVVTVDEVGASVAQVGQEFGTGIGGSFDLLVVCHVVTHGNVDSQLSGTGNGFGGVLSIGTDGDDLDEAVSVQLVHSLFGRDLDPCGVVSTHSTGSVGNKGALKVDTGDLVSVAVGLNSLLDDGNVAAVEFHGAGDDGGQEDFGAGFKELFGSLDDHIFGQFGIGKVNAVVAVDLKVDPSGIFHFFFLLEFEKKVVNSLIYTLTLIFARSIL